MDSIGLYNICRVDAKNCPTFLLLLFSFILIATNISKHLDS